MMTVPRLKRVVALVPLLALLFAVLPQQAAQANHTPAPTNVTIAGDMQSELGCPSDFNPACAATHLVNQQNGVWRGEFSIPAGTWKYKAALNDSYNESYAGTHRNGGDTSLELAAATGPTMVRFYYDHKTHAVLDSVMDKIATVAGSFQSELGCPADWSPDCVRTLMTDGDGDGKYTFTTTSIPPGTYAFKVARNENFGTSYPSGDVPLTVSSAGEKITINWNSLTNEVSIGDLVGNLTKARAHWLTRETIAWDAAGSAANSYKLIYAPAGGLQLTPTGITGSGVYTLTLSYNAAGLSQPLKNKYPYLKTGANAFYTAFTISAADLAQVPAILKGQAAIAAFDATGKLLDATELQIPGVLDDLYPYSGALGVSYVGTVPTLRVWAPTAQALQLRLFADATTTLSSTVAMIFDAATGVWSATGDASWTNKYYLYDETVFSRATNTVVNHLVTDPYSISLSRNSLRSQVVNLNDAALKPGGWDTTAKPRLDAPEDITLYELHIRDFSVNDATVPAAERGTYKAFTAQNSDGMQHLRALAKAGLTHVHLLPAFDCASIDEDKSTWQTPNPALLATYPATSTLQQQAVKDTREKDGFNWCYDPFHYTVPEGSYATNPNDSTRILEFRQMVQALSQSGLRTVMDVVYNHTNASGEADKSVLDKIVPGYYQRLNLDGNVETSTCCQNTAAEHAMMEKLMIDSLTTWATVYKVDAFRFDLMGHHPLATMEHIRDALHALTPAKDGVDGAKIYIYGEGWNFGEIADNARFTQATQANTAGSGLGTFNDRIRDAIRGAGPFDSGQNYKKQGFISGLFYDPNDLNQGTPAEQKARLLLLQDQLRVGLAGNLKAYSFIGRTGVITTGAGVDYNGSPTGYTSDPQEIINYAEAHDNMTMFDQIQLNAPAARTLDERVRMQNMGEDLLALGQGIPFFQAGQDLLRSKSFDGNSYNSGDWFNKIDWSGNSNNFGVGLPPDQDSNWSFFAPLLANSALKPNKTQISFATAHFQEMLRIRASSPLFRLRTSAAVQSQLSYLNGGPDQAAGLIVMQLTDPRVLHLDNPYTRIVVLFNASITPQTFSVGALKGQKLRLHPVQASSADATVRAASYDAASGTFSVPPRTTAVFVTTQHQIGLPMIVRK